jgi:hypothetical protein
MPEVRHISTVDGSSTLCGAAPSVAYGPEQNLPAYTMCDNCLDRLKAGPAFNGEEPSNVYQMPHTDPGPEHLKMLLDDHVTDCTPGDFAEFGQLIERDASAVKTIYGWLSENLVMIEGDSPFDIGELCSLLRVMLSAVNYFYSGECATCGDVISPYIASLRKANDDELAGAAVRGSDDDCEPGEGSGIT